MWETTHLLSSNLEHACRSVYHECNVLAKGHGPPRKNSSFSPSPRYIHTIFVWRAAESPVWLKTCLRQSLWRNNKKAIYICAAEVCCHPDYSRPFSLKRCFKLKTCLRNNLYFLFGIQNRTFNWFMVILKEENILTLEMDGLRCSPNIFHLFCII